ncbi:MAG TPA: NAD(+)/NADH kinase [Methanocorpusculum sp.]|nr:NAD(+)/NADH kinase [Methanocorpusculum sp.]
MKICIVSKVDVKEPIELAQSIGWELSNLGHEVVYEDSIASELGYDGVSLADLKADLVFVIGGDGSVLRAVRLMKKQIPVLGINQGQVGFLTDLERDKVQECLSALKPPLVLDSRMRIAVSCEGRDLGCALNEAVIVTSRPSKMLSFTVYADDVPVDTFRADGLIVSTPTGSTAYAMSVGGPIVDPKVETILLAPIAPYLLSSRPILLSGSSTVRIEMTSQNKSAVLSLDGKDQYDIGERASIIIRKAETPALFVDIGRTFYEKVEQKLRQH